MKLTDLKRDVLFIQATRKTKYKKDNSLFTDGARLFLGYDQLADKPADTQEVTEPRQETGNGCCCTFKKVRHYYRSHIIGFICRPDPVKNL